MFIRVSSFPLQHAYVIDDIGRIICYCVHSVWGFIYLLLCECVGHESESQSRTKRDAKKWGEWLNVLQVILMFACFQNRGSSSWALK